jgi:hypothetical protein
MFTIEYAKNPKYNDPSNTTVVLDVKFAEFNTELPFTANPNDVEAHGVELYNRAIAGEFGTILPFNG